MIERCDICGGVDTCPADDTIIPIRWSDIHYIDDDRLIPPDLQVTHRRKRYVIAIPREATVVGSAQRYRVAAHHHLRWVWVGQCSYAFLAPDEPDNPPSTGDDYE